MTCSRLVHCAETTRLARQVEPTNETAMLLTRRDMGKAALAALPAAYLLVKPARVATAGQLSTPDTDFGGVNVSIIAPYAFRRTANTIDEILEGVGQLGLRHVEMQAEPVEQYAGAPSSGRGGFGGRRGGPGGPTGRSGERPQRGANTEETNEPARPEGRGRRGGPDAPGAGGRGQGGRGQGGRGQAGQAPRLTPEPIAEMRARGETLRNWRLAQPMDKFEEIRGKYDNAGVSIDIVKFGLGPSMTDEEVDYCFRVAKVLGCHAITCEPPVSETRRLGKFAEQYQIRLGFHNHSNATGVENFCRPGSWEQAFFYSDWNGANVDIGHFCAGNSMSPVDFIRLYHDRITNLHLKDRKFEQGPNVPWGEGDTPIREVLQLMKREQYKFMATIELEYPVPEGSDVMTELKNCVEYCKEALA